MNLKFSWVEAGNGFRPESRCETPDEGVGQFLSDLLNDDGGLGIDDVIPWLDEGAAQMESVINGGTATADWSRERWGVKADADLVEIYFLLEDDYSASVDVRSFYEALLAWREFLRSGPLSSNGSVNKVDLHI